MKNKMAQEGYQSATGVILFRGASTGGPVRPLIMLVVENTPTGGANARQFRKVIGIWKQLAAWDSYFSAAQASTPTPASTLMILGPTYSGSVPSLKSMLREVVADAPSQATADRDYDGRPAKDFHIFISSGVATVALKLPAAKGAVTVTAQDQFTLGGASVKFTETAN